LNGSHDFWAIYNFFLRSPERRGPEGCLSSWAASERGRGHCNIRDSCFCCSFVWFFVFFPPISALDIHRRVGIRGATRRAPMIAQSSSNGPLPSRRGAVPAQNRAVTIGRAVVCWCERKLDIFVWWRVCCFLPFSMSSGRARFRKTNETGRSV